MARECSKAAARRARDANFVNRYLVGRGIDIGGAPDPLGAHCALFPKMETVDVWDLPQGDAQFMAGAPDEHYDFVHSSHCLEHLHDPREGLANWFRILKPGGHLVVLTPDEDLYEQGVFPSTFNPDHKWTFTVHKARSWSPRSLSLVELALSLGPAADIRRLAVLDEGFREGLPRFDQTLIPDAECGVELVIRKRPAAELAAGGPPVRHHGDAAQAAQVAALTGGQVVMRPALSPLAAALARYQAGAADEAAALCRPCLDDPATRPDALRLLGLAARARGDAAAAAADLRAAVAARADFADAWNSLGNLWTDGGDGRAAAAYRLALACDPELVIPYRNLANLARRANDAAAMAGHQSRALALDPADPPGWGALALARLALGDGEASSTALARYCAKPDATPPDIADAVAARLALNPVTGPSRAVAHWRRLTALFPAHAHFWRRRGEAEAAAVSGGAAQSLAATALIRARLLALDDAEAQMAAAYALQGLDAYDAAIDAYRAALAIRPDDPVIHNNLGVTLLLTGRAREGWPHHEWRFAAKGTRPPAPPFPRFRVGDLAGRRVFVGGEQGLGDSLQFIRYALALARAGAETYVGVQSELTGLFRRLPELAGVIGPGETIPPCDAHIPMLSLPLALDVAVETPLVSFPYLSAPGPETCSAAARAAAAPFPRIGLVWAGNPNHHNDAERSAPAAAFRALTEAVPASWFSLQYGPRAAEAATLPGVADLSGEIGGLLDTAAVVAALDLVISVDTAVAHLAGGLGRPVWIALPHPPDWRWTLTGDRTPWYPGARLFRRRRGEGWGPAIAAIIQALRAGLTVGRFE